MSNIQLHRWVYRFGIVVSSINILFSYFHFFFFSCDDEICRRLDTMMGRSNLTRRNKSINLISGDTFFVLNVENHTAWHISSGRCLSLEKIKQCKGVHSRAAQIWGGFLPQTPSLSLAQTVTPYQFLGPYDIVLPRPESFEVGHFRANIEIKCPTSKLSGHGKSMS